MISSIVVAAVFVVAVVVLAIVVAKVRFVLREREEAYWTAEDARMRASYDAEESERALECEREYAAEQAAEVAFEAAEQARDEAREWNRLAHASRLAARTPEEVADDEGCAFELRAIYKEWVSRGKNWDQPAQG